MTRLLNTPIIGPSAKTVDSSWIDMLAGLSALNILRTPPCFWANATSLAENTSNTVQATASARSSSLISFASCSPNGGLKPAVARPPAYFLSSDSQQQRPRGYGRGTAAASPFDPAIPVRHAATGYLSSQM